MVIKRSGVRQPFDRGKLIDGLRSATKNRPVTEEQLETVAQQVEDAVSLVQAQRAEDLALAASGPTTAAR